MTRFIDADSLLYVETAANEAILEELFGKQSDQMEFEFHKALHQYLIDVINDAPTVAMRPVKRGHWEVRKGENFNTIRCSNCGAEVNFREPLKKTRNFFTYCPDCGSYMRREKRNVEKKL